MIYIILLASLFLRLINLNQSFWLDEAINVLAVREYSFQTLVTKYALGDFHPPLYHIFLFFWTRLFGFNEIATRMLSVVFGVGTVFLFYFLFKRIFSKYAVMLATLFLATSPLHIYYSQETRMYAFTTFLALLSSYFFIELVRGKDTRKRLWFLYFLSTLLLLYSEYLPYFLLLSQSGIVYAMRKKIGIQMIKKWLMTLFFLFLCLIPWLPFLNIQIGQALFVAREFPLWNEVVGKGTLKAFVLVPLKFLIGRISIANKVLYSMVSILILTGVGGLITRFFFVKKEKKDYMTLFFLLLLPFLLAFITSLKISVFSYFRFLFLLPLFYLILGISLETFKKKSLRILAIVSILFIHLGSLTLFYTNKQFWKEDWRNAIQFIESNPERNSVAIMVNPAQDAPYRYYSKGVVPLRFTDIREYRNYTSLWLFRYVQPIFDPQDTVRHNIEESNWKKEQEYDFNGIVVWRYTNI